MEHCNQNNSFTKASCVLTIRVLDSLPEIAGAGQREVEQSISKGPLSAKLQYGTLAFYATFSSVTVEWNIISFLLLELTRRI